jgi:L-iditol 2-dehydrogenase
MVTASYDRPMRAAVVGDSGEPKLDEVSEPTGDGELLRVLACGLCGSDIEKFLPSFAGRVLGHEVVAETAAGQRVALVHHAPCESCARCRAGHETTCSQFQHETIVPGGFAERVRSNAWVDVSDSLDDARATAVEPLACVLRGAESVPNGRVLVVGQGFMGRLFTAVLERRCDEVFAVDRDPRRAGLAPDGPVDAAVLCAPGGSGIALAALEPGGTLLCFADPGAIPAELVYRRELRVVGSRSATPRHMETAAALLPELDLPTPTVFPLERFAEGLDLQRRGEALKVVFVP